jgi:cytochrome c-type biogenesis protein CcmH
MIIFWILCAGLMGLALLFVITPLLSKAEPSPDADQDQLNLEVFRQQLNELDADLSAGNLDRGQYKAARRDLERELLYDVSGVGVSRTAQTDKGGLATTLLLALAIPASAIALYLYTGNSSIIPRLEAMATGQSAAGVHPGIAQGSTPSLDVLVQRLAERMEQNPDDLEGWLMLGRSYFAIERPEKALVALEKAYGMAPENPDVVTAYAQAVASNAGGQLAGRPAELIRTALEIDPGHATARWLDGLIAYQAEDFAGAVERWEALLAGLDPQGQEAQELREFIADARERSGDAPETSSPPVPATTPEAEVAAAEAPADSGEQTAAPPEAAEGGKVTVQVSLAESLWPEADRNDTLFVYAKAASGPPMPLAVKRLTVADLPVTVTLDDSMAMMPEMRLSNFPQVTVGARISKSSQALPQSGDLVGEIGPVTRGDTDPIAVLIDRVRP